MSRDSDQPVVTNKESAKKRMHNAFKKMRSSPLAQKKYVKTAAVLLFIGVAFFGVYAYLTRNEVKVGDTTITQKKVDDYTKAIEEFKKSHPSINVGKDVKQYATDQLVLNAALHTEAKRYGVSISDDDMVKATGLVFHTQEEQDAYFKKARTTNDLQKLLHMENTTYEAKLHDKLIRTKDLTMVTLLLDMPYFRQLPQDQVQAAYDKAKARMTNDYLPLFAQHKSIQDIARKSDQVDDAIGVKPENAVSDERDEAFRELAMYRNQGVVAVRQVKNYNPASMDFNDNNTKSWIRGDIGKVYYTPDKIKELKKVGDYTGVFASKAGGFMIIRLDGESQGKYDSWGDFLQSYKKKYASVKIKTIAKSINTAVFGIANMAADIITMPGQQEAWAGYIGGDCVTDHPYRISVFGYDNGNGYTLSGAKLKIYRDPVATYYDSTYGLVNPCGQLGTYYITSNSTDQPDAGLLDPIGVHGNTFVDNCGNTPPTFSVAGDPAGYNRVNTAPWDNSRWLENTWSNNSASSSYHPLSDFHYGYPNPPNNNIDGTGPNKFHIKVGQSNNTAYTDLLVYQDSSPTPGDPSQQGDCTSWSANDPGTVKIKDKDGHYYKDYDSDGHVTGDHLFSTQTLINSSGVSPALSAGFNINSGGNSGDSGFLGNDVGGGGTYTPTNPHVVLSKYQIFHYTLTTDTQYTHDKWYAVPNSFIYFVDDSTCLSGFCYITGITGDLPQGRAKAGSTITAHVNVYNVNPSHTTLPTTLNGSDAFHVIQNGGDVSMTATNLNALGYRSMETVDVTGTISSTATGTVTVKVQPAYGTPGAGTGFWLGSTTCQRDIDLYVPPQVSASASCKEPQVSGWAYAPKNPDAPLTIDIYNGATRVGTGTTSGTSPDGHHPFTIAVDESLRDGSDKTLTIWARDPDAIQDVSTTATWTGCGTFTLSLSITSATLKPDVENPTQFCSSMKVNVSYGHSWGGPTAGVPATVTYNFTKNGGRLAGYATDASFDQDHFIDRLPEELCANTTTPVTAGDKYQMNGTLTPTSGIIDRNGNILSSTGTDTEEGDSTVNNKPYFKVYKGSISSGGDFLSTGSCTGGGQLASWFNNTYYTGAAGGYSYGAASDLHALAFLKMVGVASNQQFDPSNDPSKEAFANKVTGDDFTAKNAYSPLLGGDFGSGVTHCLDDFQQPKTTHDITGGSADVINDMSTSQGYTHTGNLTLTNTGGGGIPSGTNISVFVKGNVYIQDDITYAGGWNADNIPSFLLHATGNIYISGGVKHLDGIYSAVRSGSTGGTIYTCGTAYATYSGNPNQTYDNCRNQLYVRGAFIANHVKLLRTYGTLRNVEPSSVTTTTGTTSNSPDHHIEITVNHESDTAQHCETPANDPYPDGRNDDGTAKHNTTPDDNQFASLLRLCTSDSSIKLTWVWSWNNNGNAVLNDASDAMGTSVADTSCDQVIDFSSTGLDYGDNHKKLWACANVPISKQNIPHADSMVSDGTAYCHAIDSDSQWFGDVRVSLGYFELCETITTSTSGGGTTATPPASPGCGNADASNDTLPFDDGGNTSASSSYKTCAAEVFDFSPEMYLSKWQVASPPDTFNAITGLPPIL